MSDFKAKMHQIQLRLGDPAGGAYNAPPDPLAGSKGPTSVGAEGKGCGMGGWNRKGIKGTCKRKGKGDS